MRKQVTKPKAARRNREKMGAYLVHQHRESVDVRLFGTHARGKPEFFRIDEFRSKPPHRKGVVLGGLEKHWHIGLGQREDGRRSEVRKTSRVIAVDEDIGLSNGSTTEDVKPDKTRTLLRSPCT